MRNFILGNTKIERKMFGIEASPVSQNNLGSPVMVMDRSHISRGQSSISALPQVGARGGVRKHGGGVAIRRLVTSCCRVSLTGQL